MDSIRIKFKYTQDEFVNATRNQLFMAKVITPTSIIFMLLLLLFSIVYLILTGVSGNGIIFIAVPLFYLLMLIYMYFIQPLTTFKKTVKTLEEFELTFKPDGITLKTPAQTSSLVWKQFPRLWENDLFLYLLRGKNTYTILPKHAFSSEEQIEQLIEMAKKANPKLHYKKFK